MFNNKMFKIINTNLFNQFKGITMKRFVLLLTIIGVWFLAYNMYAEDSKEYKVEVLRKSALVDFGGQAPGTSYPIPFVTTGDPINNPKAQAAVSTGYYFVNSGDRAGKPWAPDYSFIDTTEDALNWRRVISGPNQNPVSWYQDPSRKNDGYRFFRHAQWGTSGVYANDSVDDVFAGPIPIGFEFEYGGLKFDSFYVLSNGGIMLANARYKYTNDNPPVRKVESNNYGSPNCYNVYSYDWFIVGGRTGDGTADATVDNFGWNMASQVSQQAFVTAAPPNITVSTRNLPIIAPFWGDGYLSQWDAINEQPRDRGKVYFYKDPTGNKLVVYFVNWQLKGPITIAGYTVYTIGTTGSASQYNANAMGPANDGYISANCQIVLDRTDNTVTINYERFQGRKDYGLGFYPANQLIRFNTFGCISGMARHLNFDSKQLKTNPNYTGTIPWAADYNQNTYMWSKYFTNDHTGYPDPTQSVRFKQWKNTLRVVDLAFRVRKQEQGQTAYEVPVLTSQVQDFEILAGHEQVGQLQPVAIVENLTNDIQGPNQRNYMPQDLSFRVRCAIINQATRRPLYNKYVKVDYNAVKNRAGEEAFEKVILSVVKYTGGNYEADTLNATYYNPDRTLKAPWDGVPPYGFVQIYFPPFEPNDLFRSNIGLMKAYLMLDPSDPATGESLGDEWPFDDTLNIRFWVMRHIPNDEPFVDDVTEFHVVPDDNGSPVPIPSVYKWVSVGATVVTGETVSRNPLPPRGDYLCNNSEVYPGLKISSPTIKLHRPPPSVVGIGAWGGYEMRSFPIDLLTKTGAVLTLAIQRSTNRDDWERGWSDGTLIGCEHRIVVSNWYNVYNPNYGYSTTTELCDQIHVEFKKPSLNWRDGTLITNIATDNWRKHQRRKGAPEETKMAAYTLFGGGGYMVGFLETDKDSAMAPPVYSGQRTPNGLRYDFYDDGIDFEYKKVYVPIPDTFITAPNEGGKHFRFRIRVYARNNQLSPTTIADDEDPFYVDNIRILYSTSEIVDVEMSKIEADWPYTITPASQATAIPIRMSISNNTSKQAPSFWVKASIVRESDFNSLFYLSDAWVWKGDPNDEDYEEMMALFRQKNKIARDSARWILMRTLPIYCRTKQIPFLRPGSDEPISMPTWNARLSPPGKYIIIGDIFVPGGDLEPLNDTTYSTINMTFGPMFAYHPVTDVNNLRKATNDVSAMIGEFGRGLTMRGYKMGGLSYANWMQNYPSWEVGDAGGDGGSGNFAMKFELTSEDTIFGYGAYYATKNQHPDWVSYRMFDGDEIPSNQIPGSLVQAQRGYDQITDSMGRWNEFVFVTLPNPIVLKKGIYWVAVAQLAEAGIELGASKSRMGMRCTNIYFHNPQTADKNGSAGIYLNLEKSFRIREKFGNQTNKNFFAYENGQGSGAWEPFTSTIGNPGYAHMDHQGYTPFDGQTATVSRGSWLPLIVPYLGPRTYSTSYPFKDCDIPVELTYFKGSVRQGAIDLIWETASEVNNHGFYVERKVVGTENSDWNTLPEFVSGHGTSNIPHEYNYVDTDVKPNTTYQYKLRQVDLDGTQSCDDFSNIVTLTYTEKGSIVLMPNSPNPFNDGTNLSFSIPENAKVTLEILDVYGMVVKTLVNDNMSAGTYAKAWMSDDNHGNKVASGTYIYRLTVDDKVLTGKMSLVR
ncbi:T9SS C-terminal target domain-containing protein [Bacteroidetes/Chlorobi group bacterium ChocPot_Mid]|nr:MAG: T9SS C-terminal target domain-containing protein [Bacteroidetes/Chlorobi group bacterium ChocPot_Mid]